MLPRVAGKRPARSKLPARDFLELHHHHLQTLPFPHCHHHHHHLQSFLHPPTTPTLKRNTKGPEEGSLPWRPRKPPWDGPEPLFETPRIALLISTALLMSTTQFSGHPGLWLSIYGRWRNRWDADNMSNDASYSMRAFEHGQWWQCFPAYNEVNQVRAKEICVQLCCMVEMVSCHFPTTIMSRWIKCDISHQRGAWLHHWAKHRI